MRTVLVCLACLAVPATSLARDAVPKDASVKDLVEFLKSGSDDARRESCKRLGERKDATTCPAICELVLKDSSPRVRVECVQALKRIGPNPNSAISIRAAALKDPDRKVREEAVEAIPEVDPEVGGEVALEVLAQEKELSVRKLACRAIERKAWKNAEPGLIALVADPNQVPELRRACVQAVAAIGSEAGYALLYKLMIEDPGEELRREVSAQIEHRPKPSSLEPLCKALKDKSDRVASNAAKGLKNLGLREGAKCLRDASREVSSSRLASEMNKLAGELDR